MQIISGEYKREEIKKEMQDFENKLETIKSDCGVLRDVKWQNYYILNRKETILELISIMESIENTFDYDVFVYSLGHKEMENILSMVSKLKNRLLEIDSSLEDVYRELIQCHQWIEDQKELEE